MKSPNFLNDRSTNITDHLIEPFHCTEEDSQIQKNEEKFQSGLLMPRPGFPLYLHTERPPAHLFPPRGLYFSAVPGYPGWAGLLRMSGAHIPHGKCRDCRPLHAFLIHQACLKSPDPSLPAKLKQQQQKTTQRPRV